MTGEPAARCCQCSGAIGIMERAEPELAMTIIKTENLTKKYRDLVAVDNMAQ